MQKALLASGVSLALLAAAAQAQPRYVDVSATHLPQPALIVQSKDAHAADLDGDGDLDILIAHEYRPNVILINDGRGKFTNESAERIPQLDRDSEDAIARDFDGDGDLDILFVSEDDEENEYYINDGAGVFADARDRLPTAGVTNGIASADLNGDGASDLVFGDSGQNVLLIADGDGGFVDETSARLPEIPDATQDLEFGDVDGDGDLDLIVANEDDNRLLINNGDGIFADESATRLPYRETGEETREADFGDADGDGDLDIYFANVNFRRTGAPQDRLLINDGAGRFTDETAHRLPAIDDYTMDADFIDIDGDGDLDIVTAGLVISGGLAPIPYRVLENDGSGRFAERTSAHLPASARGVGTDIEAGDYNGDGRADLYLANRAGADILLFAE
ncbi:MAG: hypothetical protein Tsb0010_05680 [Parvularculaceae bacterium]